MTPVEAAGALARLSTSLTTQALADRDVVIEAIVENEQAKVKLYARAAEDPAARTPSWRRTLRRSRSRAWRKSVADPTNFAGMHFFNPVDRMQLVEVIRGEKTSDDTVATLVALAKRIGKTPIVVRDCPGFLVNRILFPYINESLVLLEEGAAPRAIDKAATAFGMPMGPITLNDLVGLDTSLYAGRVVNTAFADRAVPSRILDELVAAGRLGQKIGAGFYSYAKGRQGSRRPGRCGDPGEVPRPGKADIERGGDHRSALPADADRGQPGPGRGNRPRARRRGHGPDPGHRLPTLPRRHPALGRQHGDRRGDGQAAQVRESGSAFAPTEMLRKQAAEKRGFYPE